MGVTDYHHSARQYQCTSQFLDDLITVINLIIALSHSLLRKIGITIDPHLQNLVQRSGTISSMMSMKQSVISSVM